MDSPSVTTHGCSLKTRTFAASRSSGWHWKRPRWRKRKMLFGDSLPIAKATNCHLKKTPTFREFAKRYNAFFDTQPGKKRARSLATEKVHLRSCEAHIGNVRSASWRTRLQDDRNAALRWDDVDWTRRQLTIGSDGDEATTPSFPASPAPLWESPAMI